MEIVNNASETTLQDFANAEDKPDLLQLIVDEEIKQFFWEKNVFHFYLQYDYVSGTTSLLLSAERSLAKQSLLGNQQLLFSSAKYKVSSFLVSWLPFLEGLANIFSVYVLLF